MDQDIRGTDRLRAALDDGREAPPTYDDTGSLVEAAGAAPLAAALALRDRLRGRAVVLYATGGNTTLEQLRALLCPSP